MAEQQHPTNDNNVEKARSDLDEFKSLSLFDTDFDVAEDEVELTKAEIEARLSWNDIRKSFIRNHDDVFDTEKKCWSQENFLKSVILPPSFQAKKVSARSRNAKPRSKRYYPLKVYPWEDFEQNFEENFSTDRHPLLF